MVFCSICVSCNWDSINCRSDVSSCTSFLMQMFVAIESSSSFFCTVSSTSRRKHLSTFCTTRQVCTKGSRGNRLKIEKNYVNRRKNIVVIYLFHGEHTEYRYQLGEKLRNVFSSCGGVVLVPLKIVRVFVFFYWKEIKKTIKIIRSIIIY